MPRDTRYCQNIWSKREILGICILRGGGAMKVRFGSLSLPTYCMDFGKLAARLLAWAGVLDCNTLLLCSAPKTGRILS